MMLIPDVVSVSQMREPAKIFELVQNGPVILTQRSKSAAVLVSIDDWNERERYVEILEAKLRYLEIKRQFRKNPPELLTLEEIRHEYQVTQLEEI
jgi:prevent-host-death family protein